MDNKNIFVKKVLEAVKIVPKGKVASYGQIAALIGAPRTARQVGQALKEYGLLEEMPWWRVVNNQGIITIKNPVIARIEQKKLLETEGVKVNKNYKLDIKKYRYTPTVRDLKKFNNDELYIKMLINKFSNL